MPDDWRLERERADVVDVVRFTVPGEPVSKARPRFSGGHAYTPSKTTDAEQVIAWRARAALLVGHREPLAGQSFGLFTRFYCRGWQRRDADNMLKLVADALNGVVWVDDSQVSEMSVTVEHGVPDPRSEVWIYLTTAALPPTLPCEVCGKPVRQYPSQPNRYCSREHAAIGSRTSVTIPCTVCGKPVTRKQSYLNRVKNPTCGEACRYASRRSPNTG